MPASPHAMAQDAETNADPTAIRAFIDRVTVLIAWRAIYPVAGGGGRLLRDRTTDPLHAAASLLVSRGA